MQIDSVPQVNKDLESQATGASDTPQPQTSYINVDTEDVVNRIKAVFVPFKNDFERLVRGNPDVVGPIWITATLAIIYSILDPSRSYEFRLFTLPFILSFLYSFTLGVPTLLGFTFRLLGAPDIGIDNLICLTGYANSVLLLALPLSYIPATWLTILVLIYALLHTLLFVFWNLKEDISRADQNRKFIMIGSILGQWATFYGILIGLVL